MPNPYMLSAGAHDSPDQGRCAMEWCAYLAGEPHTDKPKCVDPVLRRFAIALNDAWDDEQRQKLRPFLARCIGTAGDGRSQERGWLAMDWLIRTYTPRFLDLRPELAGHAAKLRALSPVMTIDALDGAMVTLREARQASAAAAAAAWDAAGDAAERAARAAAERAAGAAAWAAAGAAAERAARAAAERAAGAAAWAAAGAAAERAAGAAAERAAGAAAWAAAGAAAWAAAWDAAWDAARAALRPAVVELQQSALDLFDRMLPTEVIQLPVVEDAEQVCGVPIA